MLDYRGVGLATFHCTYIFVSFPHCKLPTYLVMLYTNVCSADICGRSEVPLTGNFQHIWLRLCTLCAV